MTDAMETCRAKAIQNPRSFWIVSTKQVVTCLMGQYFIKQTTVCLEA